MFNTYTKINSLVLKHFRFNHNIPNKKNIMNIIRIKTSEMFKKHDDNTYVISLCHTYPQWTNIIDKLFSNPKGSLKILRQYCNSAQNPYGHSFAEFYNIQNGKIIEDDVANVHYDLIDDNIIHIIPSEKYYFNNYDENKNNPDIGIGCAQQGIFERSFININIKVNKETYDKFKKYYYDLQNTNIKFSLFSHIITNKVRHFGFTESGNCCYWISSGFKHINMMNIHSNFPMVFFWKILINIIFKKTSFLSDNNVDFCIVFYEGIKHVNIPKGTYMYPFYWLKHRTHDYIWKIEDLACLKVLPKITNNQIDFDYIHVPENITNNKLMRALIYLKNIFYLS